MKNFAEIQEMLRSLTPRQRQRIATWIYHLADEMPSQVAEAAVAYKVAQSTELSFEEYLKQEEVGETRSEYVAGEVFAMCGVSREHEFIYGNLFDAFRSHLKGKPCRVFSSDFKVRLKYAAKDHVYYPDITVACGEVGLEKYGLTHPKLVVEILSPSTEATDRREKAQVYRAAPTLEEYVLVAQDEPQITIQRRSQNWRSQWLGGLDDVAVFNSIGLELALKQIYEGLF